MKVSLSYEEQILNALAHLPHKRDENFMFRQSAEFTAIRKVLQPLYEQNAALVAALERISGDSDDNHDWWARDLALAILTGLADDALASVKGAGND